MTTAKARLGSTAYELEDSTTPGVVKFIRIESTGKRTEFFCPRELIMNYAIQPIETALAILVRKALL